MTAADSIARTTTTAFATAAGPAEAPPSAFGWEEIDLEAPLPTRQQRTSSFAPRRRGPVLRWSNICMSVSSSSAGSSATPDATGEAAVKPKKILDQVWGEARPGETTAIMGASGAGKTSLFSILSGRPDPNPNISVSGDVYLGNLRLDDTNRERVRKTFAFVGQEDALHQQSTPREAIRFSAKLRLGRDTSDEEIDDLVEHYLVELGLTKCADSMIGGELFKGISGGEKRRTSVGVELVTNPATIFLDEPTSGLDSVAAKSVMKLLDKVAKSGNTVLFTIHQPSSRLFSSFDNVILIHSGRLMYSGKTSSVPRDFEALGHPIPANTNPADWILVRDHHQREPATASGKQTDSKSHLSPDWQEVSQEHTTEELERDGFFSSDDRQDVIVASESADPSLPLIHRPQTIWTQFRLLLERERLTLRRYPAHFRFTFLVVLFMGVLSGILFYGVGSDSRDNVGVLAGIMGALVLTMTVNMNMTAGIITTSMSHEKRLFLKEYASDHYGILPRMMAKLLLESLQTLVIVVAATIITYYMARLSLNFGVYLALNLLLCLNANAIATLLGSLVRDPKVAESLLALVILPQLLFSGLVVSPTIMPTWISWLQYVCTLRYTSGLALLYEFQDCGGRVKDATCSRYLATYGLEDQQIPMFWGMSVVLWVACELAAYLLMRRAARTVR